MRRPIRLLVTAAAVCALTVTAQQNVSAAPREGGTTDDALAALQRDLGLTAAQAKALPAKQDAAVALDAKLRASLGATFGGSWFDIATGRLTVTVTDEARVAEVTKAGAHAVVVAHSEAYLKGIAAELDTLTGRRSGESGTSSLAGVAGWHVDPKTNSVVVTTIKGQQRDAALSALAGYGDAVTYEQTDQAPAETTDFMDGGDVLNVNGGRCSAGFNLRNRTTGQGYLLTAGHCTATGQVVIGQGDIYFGPTVKSVFPVRDDALIRNDVFGYWFQGPLVDLAPSNGPTIMVNGYSDSPVGTAMCKSGITTGWTCGVITAKDETVYYKDGPVYGLTRHNACAEHGDSGGSNVAILSVWSPEGVTSGAQLTPDGKCLQNSGTANVSWYYPIADSLAYYGPLYGVTMR